MSEFDANRPRMERLDPIARFGGVWVERGGSITIHLTVEEAEKLAHALPFTYPWRKRFGRRCGPVVRSARCSSGLGAARP
jgi:hypothetical protein